VVATRIRTVRTLGFPTSLCDRNVMDDELINRGE
jgi:hypothetical protein